MVQWTLFGKGGVPMADKGSAKEFLLGTQASNLWLYTCEACANEKIIPKKYRYTVGSSLIQEVESICDLIEEANLLDTRIPAECEKRVSIQLHALGKLGKMQRKIKRLLESKEYPGVNPGCMDEKRPDGQLYVRQVVRRRQSQGKQNGCPAVKTTCII